MGGLLNGITTLFRSMHVDRSDESDNESIMMSEQDMENINYGDDSDHDLISTEML